MNSFNKSEPLILTDNVSEQFQVFKEEINTVEAILKKIEDYCSPKKK